MSKQSEDEVVKLPQAVFHPSDIRALAVILDGYLPALQKLARQSQLHRADLFHLRGLQRRLVQVGLSEALIPLTSNEIQALDRALTGFSSLVRQKIPFSASREDILRRIAALHQQLSLLFP